MGLSDFKTLTDILQNLTLTGATFVAAWWAYTTLTYKEKIDELSAIAKKIVEIHTHIEGTATTYNLKQTISKLSESDDAPLMQFKYEAEGRLEALKLELQALQELSLRVSFIFRFLNITAYQSELIMLSGIENWNETAVKDSLLQAKLKILSDIDRQVNTHDSFLKRIYISLQNVIFRIKNLSN